MSFGKTVVGLALFTTLTGGHCIAKEPAPALPKAMSVAEAGEVDDLIYKMNRIRNMVTRKYQAIVDKEIAEQSASLVAELKKIQDHYKFRFTDDKDGNPMKGNPLDTVSVFTGEILRGAAAKH